jgi:hypothetical protein
MADPKQTARQIVARLAEILTSPVNVFGLSVTNGKTAFRCSFDPGFGSDTVYVNVDDEEIGWRIMSSDDVHTQPLDGDDPIARATEGIARVLQQFGSSV